MEKVEQKATISDQLDKSLATSLTQGCTELTQEISYDSSSEGAKEGHAREPGKTGISECWNCGEVVLFQEEFVEICKGGRLTGRINKKQENDQK